MYLSQLSSSSGTPPSGPLPTNCVTNCTVQFNHPVNIGDAYAGGYYAGAYRTTTSVYALIVPDKSYRVTSAQAPSKIGANNNSWANSGGLLYTIGAGYNTRNQVDGYSFTEQYYNWAISNNQLNYQPYLKYVKNLSRWLYGLLYTIKK